MVLLLVLLYARVVDVIRNKWLLLLQLLAISSTT
jgi:hypothetical protein